MKTKIRTRIICTAILTIFCCLAFTSGIYGQTKKVKSTESSESQETDKATAKAFIISWLNAWQNKDWVKVMEGIDNDGRHNITGSTSRLFNTVEGLINYKKTSEPTRTIVVDSVTIDVASPLNVMATARYSSNLSGALKTGSLDIFLLEKKGDVWQIKSWNPQEFFPVVYDNKIQAVWNYQRELPWRFYDASNNLGNMLLFFLEDYKKNGTTPNKLGDILGTLFTGNVNPNRNFNSIVASKLRFIQSIFYNDLEVPEITGNTAKIRFNPNSYLLMNRNITKQEYLEFYQALFCNSVANPGTNCKLIDEGDTWLLSLVFDPEAAAEKMMQEALMKGDSVKALMIKATGLIQSGKTKEASEILINIMEHHPNNKEAVQYWLIANMKRTPDGEKDAILTLDSLGQIYPQNSGIVFFKTFIQAEYGQNEEALAGVEKLIALQPDTADNWILKGQMLSAMNKHQDAIDAFDKATLLNPKQPDTWFMKASVQAKMGKLDEAIGSMTKGIEIVPNYPVSFYNRACYYCLKGDKANALADLEKAISMNPNYKESAVKDEDFKTLYEDEDFKKLTK